MLLKKVLRDLVGVDDEHVGADRVDVEKVRICEAEINIGVPLQRKWRTILL